MAREKIFDVVIIGTGLGGLVAACLLVKKGYSVQIIEKNRQYGGALQTFAFKKEVFDSCVHYFGSMFPGETQYKIFDYLEVLDALDLEYYDEDGFDRLQWGDDKTYVLPQDIKAAAVYLKTHFPHQKQEITNYFELIERVSDSFPLYKLALGDENSQKSWVQDWDLVSTLQDLFTDEKLIQVLLGNAFLYNGQINQTPFYEHALIMYSYFKGAVKIKNGSSHLTKALLNTFYKYGGVSVKNTLVEKIEPLEDEQVLVVAEDLKVRAKNVIYNGNLKQFPELFEEGVLPKRWTRRVKNAEQSMSCMMIHTVVDKKKMDYPLSNIYWNSPKSFLKPLNAVGEWPFNLGVYFTEDRKHPGFTSSMTVLAYIDAAVFEDFFPKEVMAEKDFDILASSEAYEILKNEKAEAILDLLNRQFPELRKHILDYQVASPVTMKKYLNYEEGTMYGIIKDSRFLLKNTFLSQSPLNNVWLTGQDVGMHGVLGVSITAIHTVMKILGQEKGLDLLKEIRASY